VSAASGDPNTLKLVRSIVERSGTQGYLYDAATPRGPITDDLLRAHLAGSRRLGALPFVDQAHVGCLRSSARRVRNLSDQ
jgi:hypothetical protein